MFKVLRGWFKCFSIKTGILLHEFMFSSGQQIWSAHNLTQGQGLNCKAIFGLLNSPVQALQFASNGAKLTVGYECGRVVLDINSLSVSFLTDCLSNLSSPVISMTWIALMQIDSHIKSPKLSESKIPDNAAEELIFVLTKDAKIYVIHGRGCVISSRPVHLKESTVIYIYVIDGNITVSELCKQKQPQHSVRDSAPGNESSQDTNLSGINHLETENHSGRSLKDPLILLCCKDALLLYHTKYVVEGNNKPVSKVKLAKSCCWTTTFKKYDVCGVVLLYQTGEMEVRFRIGERDLLNVNFKMEFQGKHGEDNEFYRKWADLFGFYNLCLVFMIKCLQLQLRLRLASPWIIKKGRFLFLFSLAFWTTEIRGGVAAD